ncbi:MAG TPA: hypothetical protein VK923_06965 [Euzebyales bacterium]|nr:hypothetical protein [Euzebyales bacterium]
MRSLARGVKPLADGSVSAAQRGGEHDDPASGKTYVHYHGTAGSTPAVIIRSPRIP